MIRSSQPKPQRTRLFRIIAFFTHFQIGYLVRTMKSPRLFVILFAVSAGAVALGIITAVAYLTDLPLVFPPLAASAFIIFYTPMSERASPKNVILAHTMGLLAGLSSLLLLRALFPESDILNPSHMSFLRVATIGLAMALSSALMILLKCVHPPAAATALIAAMGYIISAAQVSGFIAAVVLLVLEAFLVNRVLGGIPYPCWRYDPKVVQDYRALAGLSNVKMTFWELMSTRIFQRR